MVGRTHRGLTGAALRHVADAGRRPAGDVRGLEAVLRAIVASAVAALRDVAVADRGTADVGALHVGRARDVGTGARLLEIADAGRRPAHRAGRLDGVRRAVVARPIAALVGVTDIGGGTAHVRALPVRGTRGVAPAAAL